MKYQYYDALIAPYKERQKKRILISAAVMVVGFLLAASGIGAVIGIVALVYAMMETGRTASLSYVRKKSLEKLEKQGKRQQVMDSLQFAKKMELDGLTYAWTDEYLCLPHGVLLPLQHIAWVFHFTHRVTYMMIPVMKMNSCKACLLDGTDALVFYGKAKDKQAFDALLSNLKNSIPHLLIGHTPENQEKYKEMVVAYRNIGNHAN